MRQAIFEAISEWWTRRHMRTAGMLVLGTSAGLACSDLSGLTKQQLPDGISDPSTQHTRAGALAAYNNAFRLFGAQQSFSLSGGALTNPQGASAGIFVKYVLISGLLTDELESGMLGGNQLNYQSNAGNLNFLLLDTRQLVEGVASSATDPVYSNLQGLRNAAVIAVGALAAYDTVDSPALRGHLHALIGYSELFLADMFCAGVPLSTLDFNANFTYRAGATTDQLYQAAIAQFDTAIALSADSVTVLNLARVGRGRAYLARGKYDSAAAAVAQVPTTYSYQGWVNWGMKGIGGVFAGGADGNNVGTSQSVTVADRQGADGLPYRSNDDPRTASASWGKNQFRVPQYAPVEYGGAALASGTSIIAPIPVASGIEARLIQAEAAYHGVATGSGDWLAQLNALRQSAPVQRTGVPMPDSLPPLQDPGASVGDTARIRLLFQERAYWLFLTGTRQGDLRRLIRNYHLAQDAVYPTGSYPLFGNLQRFGTNVDAPIPVSEQANPLFHGCLGRGQ
jgi:hypothetical protein